MEQASLLNASDQNTDNSCLCLKLHILSMDWKMILGPTVCSIFNRRAFCSKRAWRVFFSHVLFSQTKELACMLYLWVNDVKISNPLFLCFQNHVYLLIHCADSFFITSTGKHSINLITNFEKLWKVLYLMSFSVVSLFNFWTIKLTNSL